MMSGKSRRALMDRRDLQGLIAEEDGNWRLDLAMNLVNALMHEHATDMVVGRARPEGRYR